MQPSLYEACQDTILWCAGPFEFDFEDEKLSSDDVKARVYAEILHYHPEGGATAKVEVASPSGKDKAAASGRTAIPA